MTSYSNDASYCLLPSCTNLETFNGFFIIKEHSRNSSLKIWDLLSIIKVSFSSSSKYQILKYYYVFSLFSSRSANSNNQCLLCELPGARSINDWTKTITWQVALWLNWPQTTSLPWLDHQNWRIDWVISKFLTVQALID